MAQVIGIEIDLYRRDTWFPGLGGCQLRIILSSGHGIVHNSCNTAVFIRTIGFLTPFKDMGLAEKGLKAFGQYRAKLRAIFGRHNRTVRIKGYALGLGIEYPFPGPGIGIVYGAAVIYGDRHPGCLEAGKVNFGYQPGKKWEDLIKGNKSLTIRRGGLINRTIPPAQIDCLAKDTLFSGIPKTISIDIIVYMVFHTGKPLKNRNISKINGRAADNGHAVGGKDNIKRIIPDYQLITAVGNVGNGEGAVAVCPGGVNAPTNTCSTLIQADPWSGMGKRDATEKRVGRWPGKMQIDNPATNSGTSGKHGCINKRMIRTSGNKAYGSMGTGGTELLKKRRLICLDPGINDLGTLDG